MWHGDAHPHHESTTTMTTDTTTDTDAEIDWSRYANASVLATEHTDDTYLVIRKVRDRWGNAHGLRVVELDDGRVTTTTHELREHDGRIVRVENAADGIMLSRLDAVGKLTVLGRDTDALHAYIAKAR